MTGYQVVHMLEGVVTRGTAQRLRDLNRPLFGKTGTTSGPNDVWFIGGTPDIVAGGYVGYDQPRSLGGWAPGGRIAAPHSADFARATLHYWPLAAYRDPGGIPMSPLPRRPG